MPTLFLIALAFSLQASPLDFIPDEQEILAVSDGMKQFLDSKIDRRDLPKARLDNLVSVIFHENTLGFTYQGGETRTAAETFASRGGNCLSFTNMFIAMARYVDLDVRFHEVDIVPIWAKRGKVVVVGRHVNVVAYIGGDPYEVDLVPSVSRIRVGGRIVSDRRGWTHYYSNKGVDMLAQGSLYPALRYFERATRTDPTASFAWGNLAVAQFNLGFDQSAEDSYLRAVKTDKDNLAALFNLAIFYESTGREDKAQRYLKKAEKFRNRNPYYHYGLGEEAYRLGHYEEAVHHYKAALDRKNEEHLFHFALAKAYAQLGETEEAEKCLRKARKYAPDAPWEQRYSRKLEMLAARASASHSTGS